MADRWPRADPAALAAFDSSTKVCTMNCGPAAGDPRSSAERRLLCDECTTPLPCTCRWTQDDEGTWTTACGEAWVFSEGGTPAEHRARFCFCCGKPIEADEDGNGAAGTKQPPADDLGEWNGQAWVPEGY